LTTSARKIPPVKIVFPERDRHEIGRRIDRCLATGQVGIGENVTEFERNFADYTGTRFAVAVSNGGTAIEALMSALGVEGREVLVPTNTAFATAVGVIRAGGSAKLMDTDPATFSVSVETVQHSAGEKTVGVIVVHIGGIVTPEIAAIRKFCDSKGLWLVEDCAHAHGSEYAGQRAGTFGVAGAYSFFATKVMTTGEGGMVVTDDESIAKKVARLRDYGKPDPWVTYSTELGTNWRLNEWAGAIGVVQLRRLDEMITWREKIASDYTRVLEGIQELRPVLPTGRCSWYKYIVLLQKGVDRERFRTAAKEKGVSLSGGVYDTPLHRQPVFDGAVSGSFPDADDVCSRHICLPIYYGMTGEEAEYVVETVKALL